MHTFGNRKYLAPSVLAQQKNLIFFALVLVLGPKTSWNMEISFHSCRYGSFVCCIGGSLLLPLFAALLLLFLSTLCPFLQAVIQYSEVLLKCYRQMSRHTLVADIWPTNTTVPFLMGKMKEWHDRDVFTIWLLPDIIWYTLRKKVFQRTFFGASGCHK